MDLANYKYDYYVQRNVVKIAGDVGTASYTFKGMPAVYDIKIAYVDEDDGNCTYTVDIKGKEVASWVADKNPSKDSIFIYSINDIKLDYGAQIRITGTRNKGEGARIAYLDITYSGGMTLKSFLGYAFSSIINNMPTTSIFVLLLVIITFLIVNILFIILFRSRKKRPEISHMSSKQPDNSSIVNDNSTGISDRDSGTTTTDTSCQPIGTSLIDKMKMYLDNNFSDTNFSVQEMADNFNLSVNYLSSYYKEQTSENIINYITYLRIEKAKHLLVTTDFPIKKISESSGYYNVSSFIRRFKQVTGVTPGKYREDNMG
jgi:AraC-like DNA-binding protein